jgi:hypothetical protein
MRLGAGHRVGPFERTAELGGATALAAALGRLVDRGPRFEIPKALSESDGPDPTGPGP